MTDASATSPGDPAEDLVTGGVLLNQALSNRSPSAVALLLTALGKDQAVPGIREVLQDKPDGPDLRMLMLILGELGYELRVTPLGSDRTTLSADWMRLIS